MTFRDIKVLTRALVHSTFAVPCTVDTGTIGPIAVTARLHAKNGMGGDLLGEGYSSIREFVSHVIFSRPELTAAGFGVLPRNTLVVFPGYLADDADLTVQLDTKEPSDGPVTERWTVTWL